ncbi:iron reductase [Amylocystis lapponica]|nr:iron reductase [Amylocystis lapponica]
MSQRRRRSSTRGPSTTEAQTNVMHTTRSFSLRRLPLAIANAYRVFAFRWTLQVGESYTLNMAEVFVTCAYIIALFVWAFINTTDLEGNKLSPAYWANRAGAIGSSQFPLVTVLGTKNNVLSYITGISYDKLNYVHRMAARVVFVVMWVHGGTKLATLSPEFWGVAYVPSALTAMVAFSVLILVSLRPIRASAYELFFLTHFSMVLIFLIGSYFHTRHMKMSYYLWPCFLIWGLDRLIRGIRWVVFNHLYFRLDSTKANLDGTVELLSPHFVRLRLTRPPHLHWTPGQTAYLTVPSVSRLPLEAHPFTIASIEGLPEDNDEKSNRGESAPYWQELVFLINVREGFTKRLAEAAGKGKTVGVLVDGPYGFSPDLDSDDTVILVAGGSGISFTLSTLLGIVNGARNETNICRRIVFIWAIRDAAHIDWVSQTISQALRIAPQHLSISILIFVTSGKAPPLNGQHTNSDESISNTPRTSTDTLSLHAPSLLSFTAVQVIHCRPDLCTLLREEASVNTGRMSVTVCGSQAIACACRSALGLSVAGPSSILRGGPSIVLHVESFGYA